jgi:hypothetical protein
MEGVMGESKPEIELQDAVEDYDSHDLLDAVPDFEEHSEISSVVKAAFDVGRAEYTLPTSEDEDAPEVICTLADEFPDERVTSASRSVGHGLRRIVEPEKVDNEDVPNVIVRIEI